MKTQKKTVTVTIIEKSIRENREAGDDPFAELTVERFRTFKGIKDSREHVGAAHDLYVRQLLHAGRIEGVKVQYKGYQKWLIDPESIDYYHAHKGNAQRLTSVPLTGEPERRIADSRRFRGYRYRVYPGVKL